MEYSGHRIFKPCDARDSALHAGHAEYLSGADAGDRPQRFRYQWKQIFERVTDSAEYDDAQSPIRDVLLVLETSIASHEDGEACLLRLVEQDPVLESGPRLLLDRPHVMAHEMSGELPGQLFIEENAHGRSQHRERPRVPLSPVLARPWEKHPGTRRGYDRVRGSR